MRIEYEIAANDEPAAGLFFSGEKIVVEVESGNPGGEAGEFEAEMGKFLSDWFDSKILSCRRV